MMFKPWQIDSFKGDLQSRGITIWPDFQHPTQYINSDIQHASVRSLSLSDGDNVLIRVLRDLKEREHTNFAFFAFPADRNDYIDDDFNIKSVFLIKYASWK